MHILLFLIILEGMNRIVSLYLPETFFDQFKIYNKSHYLE